MPHNKGPGGCQSTCNESQCEKEQYNWQEGALPGTFLICLLCSDSIYGSICSERQGSRCDWSLPDERRSLNRYNHWWCGSLWVSWLSCRHMVGIQGLPELLNSWETVFDVEGHGALNGLGYRKWNGGYDLAHWLQGIAIVAAQVCHAVEGIIGNGPC